MNLKCFLMEILSNLMENKDSKSHQKSTVRIKANLQLLRTMATRLKRPLQERGQRQEKKDRYFRAGS